MLSNRTRISTTPRTTRTAPGFARLTRFIRLALIASVTVTGERAISQDVLLDLPAPRSVPVKPVTGAPVPPEPVTPPPATDAVSDAVPAATDAEMLTDDEAAPSAGPAREQMTRTDRTTDKAGKDTAMKDKAGKDPAKNDRAKDDAKSDKKDGKKKEETNDCCGRPGMIPVCRCKPITKKKSHTEYDTKCELVCVPGCGLLHGHCLGGHGAGHAPGCCDDGCPSCADVRIRQRKTLQKRVTEKEYDSYEFKIEWVPARCAFGGCTECGDGRHGHGGFFDWLLSHE
ncbi:MAG: hypothetical protein EBS51_00270 [Planctomycetia bacterium]|nr:hypothetical protein [Planctomycetia bacterium]